RRVNRLWVTTARQAPTTGPPEATRGATAAGRSGTPDEGRNTDTRGALDGTERPPPGANQWRDSGGKIRDADDVPEHIYRGVDVRHTGRGDVALKNPAQFKPYQGTVSAGDQARPGLLAGKPGWVKIDVKAARDRGVRVFGDGGT